MKKSKVLRKLTKLLQTWEGSKLEGRTSKEILELLEKEGMLPPFSKQADLGCECGCKGRCAIGHDWDNERLPDGANQVDVYYR